MMIAGLAKSFFSGDLETFTVIAAPALGGAITYFGRTINFVVTEEVTSRWAKRSRKRKRETLNEITDTLIKMRDAPGITNTRKREINENIRLAERLFAEQITDDLRK